MKAFFAALALFFAPVTPPADTSAEDPPPITDLESFPAPEIVRLNLAWYSAHRDYLVASHACDVQHKQWWKDEIRAANAHAQPWELLADAQRATVPRNCGWGCGECWTAEEWEMQRRYQLEWLRLALGPDAYSHGAMPGIVPPHFR